MKTQIIKSFQNHEYIFFLLFFEASLLETQKNSFLICSLFILKEMPANKILLLKKKIIIYQTKNIRQFSKMRGLKFTYVSHINLKPKIMCILLFSYHMIE